MRESCPTLPLAGPRMLVSSEGGQTPMGNQRRIALLYCQSRFAIDTATNAPQIVQLGEYTGTYRRCVEHGGDG